jgi:hypothetical protein
MYSPTGKWGCGQRLDNKSRMTGDCHVRICESLGVRSPRATRLIDSKVNLLLQISRCLRQNCSWSAGFQRKVDSFLFCLTQPVSFPPTLVFLRPPFLMKLDDPSKTVPAGQDLCGLVKMIYGLTPLEKGLFCESPFTDHDSLFHRPRHQSLQEVASEAEEGGGG